MLTTNIFIRILFERCIYVNSHVVNTIKINNKTVKFRNSFYLFANELYQKSKADANISRVVMRLCKFKWHQNTISLFLLIIS